MFPLKWFIPQSLGKIPVKIVVVVFFSRHQLCYMRTHASFSQKSEQQGTRLIDPFSGGN